jgi:hypothetical protein
MNSDGRKHPFLRVSQIFERQSTCKCSDEDSDNTVSLSRVREQKARAALLEQLDRSGILSAIVAK